MTMRQRPYSLTTLLSPMQTKYLEIYVPLFLFLWVFASWIWFGVVSLPHCSLNSISKVNLPYYWNDFRKRDAMLKHNRTRTHCIEKALFTFEFIFANTFSPHGPLSSTLSFLSVHLQLAHPTRIRQLNGNVRPFYLFRCVQFLKFYLSNFQLSRAPPQLKSRTSCLYCKPPEHSDVYNHFHCKHK